MPKMEPPESGITVRMYRQGHGDCFLLSTMKEDGQAFYMVIDCGLWTGSEIEGNAIENVVADIAESTERRVDVLLITHEHMDHVSGFAAKRPEPSGVHCWDEIAIGEVWLAWTEDATDPDANDLRRRFDDVLLGLLGAAADPRSFGLDENDHRVGLLQDLLTLHTGETDLAALSSASRNGALGLAGATERGAGAVAGVSNKLAMQRMRRRANGGVRFLKPEKGPYALPGVDKGLRIFALGPPRDVKHLLSLEPRANEEFRFGLDGPALGFLQALSTPDEGARPGRPFSPRYGVQRISDFPRDEDRAFFRDRYGQEGGKDHPEAWRRIDGDWLDTAEGLALRLNNEVNNTSLVVAIELPKTGKVLLFTGDAQRGSWVSWARLEWAVDGRTVKAPEVLARTVFYKVGHHGSHNATLNGRASDPFVNLDWLGLSEFADEFVAMIPANKPWATKKPRPWKHPLEAIEKALLAKASGRVFRMDAEALPAKPAEIGDDDWERFTLRASWQPLFVQYDVLDQ